MEVRTLTGAGETVVASGAGIDPSSLALAGSRLYWLDNGQPQTAELR